MKVREVIRMIEDDGWYLVTLNSIFRQALEKEEEKCTTFLL